MKLAIILATTRRGRQSKRVAEKVIGIARQQGFLPILIDVRDFRVNATDNTETSPQAKKLKNIIKKVKYLAIVSPEYNRSYPGEFKMMMDLLFDDWKGKHAVIFGVSSGPWGGARAVEQIKLLCATLRIMPVADLLFPNIVDHPLDDEKAIINTLQKLKEAG